MLTGRNRKGACVSSLFSGLIIWEELWLQLHITVRKPVASSPNTLIFRFAVAVFPGVCVLTLHSLFFLLCGFSLLWLLPHPKRCLFLAKKLEINRTSERTEPERILYSFAENFIPIDNASTQESGRNAGDFMVVKPRSLRLKATLLIHLVPASCQVLVPYAGAGGGAPQSQARSWLPDPQAVQDL